ncbi:MAG: DUF2207 domain-containing protein [Euryarchaeota archaeon]|nr:DUF2207 domain-containing protein [Euryarchaeota archaeon]
MAEEKPSRLSGLRTRVDHLLRRWRKEDRGDDGERVSFIVVLTGLTFVLIVFLLSLPLADMVITDGSVRWAFFLILCIVLALIILVRAYPRRSADVFTWKGYEIVEERSGTLKSSSVLIGRAMDGQTFSQMNAYQDLKEAAITRLMVRRRISREGIADLLKDPERLREMVGDDELAAFMITDFRRIYLDQANGVSHWSRSFDYTFEKLLRKVEEWH